MSSIKNQHEKKVNNSRSWGRIHGPMTKKKYKRVIAEKIPIEDIIFLFLGTARTPNPGSDVIHRIKDKWECSDYVAGKIYQIGLQYVKQEWFLVGITNYAIWIRNKDVPLP